jgi:hypothetical protein
MLCFEFCGDPHIKIGLCEETICYSAYRKEGLKLAATIAVTPGDSEDRIIYALHPRELDVVSLGSWKDTPPEQFPYYSYLFSNIAKKRLFSCGQGMYELKTFRGGNTLSTEPPVVVQALGPENPKFRVKDQFARLSSKVRANAPYTCLEIGPFPEGNATYLLRAECRLGQSSFQDLIPEDEVTGTRLYRVYGPEHIHGQIRSVHMPRCMVSSNPGDFTPYEDFLDETLGTKEIIVPNEYSIVAVDNPNCNPARLHCIDLTNDLFDVTTNVDGDIYDGREMLQGIRDRIHWFVTRHPSPQFFLQLVGPMAISDIAERKACLQTV